MPPTNSLEASIVRSESFVDIHLLKQVIRIRSVFYCSMMFLFVWRFSSHSNIFHSYGDIIITGEGLHILICTRQTWPLSIEGSSASNTYCHTEHSLYGNIRGPVALADCLPVKLSRRRYIRPGIEHPTFSMRGERFN